MFVKISDISSFRDFYPALQALMINLRVAEKNIFQHISFTNDSLISKVCVKGTGNNNMAEKYTNVCRRKH